MFALELYEAGICACGFHSSLTADKANAFTFESRTCGVCGSTEQWARIQAADDDKFTAALSVDAPPGERRPGDGRKTFIKRLSAQEAEERRANSSA